MMKETQRGRDSTAGDHRTEKGTPEDLIGNEERNTNINGDKRIDTRRLDPSPQASLGLAIGSANSKQISPRTSKKKQTCTNVRLFYDERACL